MTTLPRHPRINWAPYGFLAPAVALYLIFGLYPTLKGLGLAFFITSGPRSLVWTGLGNFEFLFSNSEFYTAVRNTLVFTLCSLLIQLPLSLGLALLLNRRGARAPNLLRLVFFSPNLFGQVFVSILFAVIFLPKFGLMNRLLHFLIGLPTGFEWLTRASMVMPALVLTSLWLYVGFNMIYFLAALQAVDPDLYDAAYVDGAGPLLRFRHVTLPGIRPVLVLVIMLSTIGSFQLFELPYLMLNNTPGPDNAGMTIVMYMFLQGFVLGDLGYAAAIGWVFVLALIILTSLQLRFGGGLSARAE